MPKEFVGFVLKIMPTVVLNNGIALSHYFILRPLTVNPLLGFFSGYTVTLHDAFYADIER